MENTTFADLNLPEPLMQAVVKLGFETPSPIQAQAIPAAMTGIDIVGLSQTGSGKTAAFALPTLAKIDTDLRQPQALILCPTRELALQVCEQTYQLGSHLPGFRIVPVYGGAPIDRQIRDLRKGAQIIVGTPGRLLDHLRRRTFSTIGIQTVILDEADRMLDMGFREEMEELLAQLPDTRQTLFFSATMSRPVENLIKRFGNDAQTIQVERHTKTVDTIEQAWYEVRHKSKVEVLTRLLDMNPPRLAIVFANTKRVVDETVEELLGRGYSADRLHGDMNQQMRERTLRRFRDGDIDILVATDVAARGLDVDEIDLVVNLELPHDPEDYVHRIGRTGRAGRAGRAVTFIFGREVHRLQNLERALKQTIPRQTIPSQEVVEGKRADVLFELVKERLSEKNFENYESAIDRLLDQDFTPTDIASTLMTMLRESQGKSGGSIPEDDPNQARGNTKRRERGDRPERRDRNPANRAGRFEQDERDGFNRRGHDDQDERGGPRGRGDRRERGGPKDKFEVQPVENGMSRLFLTVGKEGGVRPGDLVGMFYNEAEMSEGTLGRITMFPRHSIVDVPESDAKRIIGKLGSAKLRGRAFRVDFDRRAED